MRAGGGLARDIYLAQPRHAPWRGTAAPRSVARQSPATSTIANSVAATSALCRATMHGATQVFGRARTIGAAKNVSLKKTGSNGFKISFQKVLKLKKITILIVDQPFDVLRPSLTIGFSPLQTLAIK